jgi:hypothetical protein
MVPVEGAQWTISNLAGFLPENEPARKNQTFFSNMQRQSCSGLTSLSVIQAPFQDQKRPKAKLWSYLLIRSIACC